MSGYPFEIIGVTPAGFFGVDVGHRFDVAVPLCSEPILEPDQKAVDQLSTWWLAVIGRLKPSLSIAQASAQLDAISPGTFQATVSPAYQPEDAKSYLNLRLGAFPAGGGVSSIRSRYETPLVLLLSIAGLVLLIACANLANLMLARASARERELAIRLAMGASRERLLFQLLSESLLLALCGAASGIALASVLDRFLLRLISRQEDQIFLNTALDWRILSFTAGLAILTCVLFGLIPALRATRVEPSAAMRASGRSLSEGRERLGLRRLLVASQVALSLVLLVGAWLFVRSLTNLLTLNPGFRENGILLAYSEMTRFGFSADRQRVINHDILERLRHAPGIESAATFFITPVSGSVWNRSLILEESAYRKEPTDFNRVSDGYFQTLGIRLLAGRDFNEHDTLASPKAAVVNEAFARQYLDGANPVGKRFRIVRDAGETEPTYEIVGLVQNTKYQSLREHFVPIVYEAGSQEADPDHDPSFVVRSSLSMPVLTSTVAHIITDVEPRTTITFQVLKQQIQGTLLPERLMATLSGFFGLLALVLATVGLYGVMAYSVARRRNEIGIRMALGADWVSIVSMVVREAAALVMVGITAGVILALVAGRAAGSLLYGVQSWDPGVVGLTVGCLALVGLLASVIPARRAASVSPVEALRVE